MGKMVLTVKTEPRDLRGPPYQSLASWMMKPNYRKPGPGEAYLVGGELYVWSEVAETFINMGNIQGPPGSPGKDGEGMSLHGDEWHTEEYLTDHGEQGGGNEHTLAEAYESELVPGSAGFMSPKDKALIDSAVNYAYPNTLVQRDNNGNLGQLPCL